MCLYAAIWILCETKLICCCLPEKERGGGDPKQAEEVSEQPLNGGCWLNLWNCCGECSKQTPKVGGIIKFREVGFHPTSMSLEVNCCHLNIHFIPKILYFASDTWYFDAGLNSKPGCVESKISWEQVPMSRNSTRKLFMK